MKPTLLRDATHLKRIGHSREHLKYNGVYKITERMGRNSVHIEGEDAHIVRIGIVTDSYWQPCKTGKVLDLSGIY